MFAFQVDSILKNLVEWNRNYDIYLYQLKNNCVLPGEHAKIMSLLDLAHQLKNNPDSTD